MNQPVAVLGKVEEEVSALLMAGLATRRGGRERLADLAAEASALKMERLAQELRALAQGEEPGALAGSAFTTLAMARKLKERLLPWPDVTVENCLVIPGDPAVRIAASEPVAATPGLQDLVYWMESGNDFLRAHAVYLLAEMGEEAVPDLGRLAAKAPTAVRREAIRALGRIGGEAAMDVLLGLADVSSCLRVLFGAVLPYGDKAVPPLAAVLDGKAEKKNQERRRIAAALLYRLDAFDVLEPLVDGEGDQLELAFGYAGRARTGRSWQWPPKKLGNIQWDATFLGPCLVAFAEAEASSKIDPLIELLDNGPVDEVKVVGRWVATGSPLEKVLAERYLDRMVGGNAKSRQRAASFLSGLAYPPVVSSLAALLARGEVDLAQATNVLGETGGSQAIGILLDMLGRNYTVFGTLDQIGDPGYAPALIDILERSLRPGARNPSHIDTTYFFEHSLASLGDGVADLLGREMRSRQGTPVAASLQRALLEMKGPRAKKALEGIDTESVEVLVTRLGHPNLGPGAVKALTKKGDAVIGPLETLLHTNDLSACKDALAVLGGIGTEAALKTVREMVEERLPGTGSTQGANDQLCAAGIDLLHKRKWSGGRLYATAMTSRSYVVAHAGSQALAKLGGDEVVSLILPLLDSSNPLTRTKALEVAGTLRMLEAEGKAAALLTDKDYSVQAAAAQTLGQLAAAGGEQALRTLGEALLAGHAPWVVVNALGITRNRSAIPYLKKYASITKSFYSHQANSAIKKIEAEAPSTSPTRGLGSKLRGLLGGR